MININQEVFDATVDEILPASASDLTNLKQVLQDSGFSDDDLKPVMQVIDQRLADLEAGQTELEEILEREDVKDAIQSQLDSALSEKDGKIKGLESELKDSTKTLKQVLVDSYVAYALILHKKDEVNFEDLDSSINTLREELSSKPYKELNDSLSALQDEFIDAFKQNPSDMAYDPTSKKDNLHDSDNNDDPDGEKSQPIRSLVDVLSALIPKNGDEEED